MVFGGRRHDHTLLNDAWEATLSWPNVTWRRIGPSDGAHVPGPRKGHSAVLVGDAETPQMVGAWLGFMVGWSSGRARAALVVPSAH